MNFEYKMAQFNEQTINAIWRRAKEVNGYNPEIWRQDFAGAWIRRDLYGLRHEFGWEIDHIKPVSKGGTNDIKNLIALHWENNNRKSDDYPEFYTSLSSNGNKNIQKEQSWMARV